MGGLGTTEILVIAVVALVLFGPSKIPEFARQLGRAVNMVKKPQGRHGRRRGPEEGRSGEKGRLRRLALT